MFAKTANVSYKVIAVTKGGKELTFNYIESVEQSGDFIVMTGTAQSDGSMIRRDHVVARDVVAMLDVRVIRTDVRMPSAPQQQASAPAEDATAMF